jgi:hypothetical protein
MLSRDINLIYLILIGRYIMNDWISTAVLDQQTATKRHRNTNIIQTLYLKLWLLSSWLHGIKLYTKPFCVLAVNLTTYGSCSSRLVGRTTPCTGNLQHIARDKFSSKNSFDQKIIRRNWKTIQCKFYYFCQVWFAYVVMFETCTFLKSSKFTKNVCLLLYILCKYFKIYSSLLLQDYSVKIGRLY